MEIDRGYISPQFVTNNERMLCEYENALVLITDMKIEAVKDIIPILEQVRVRVVVVVYMLMCGYGRVGNRKQCARTLLCFGDAGWGWQAIFSSRLTRLLG